MQIYEETQQSIIEVSPNLEEIGKQLKRTADALEKLSSTVGDDDSSLPYVNISASCGVMNV